MGDGYSYLTNQLKVESIHHAKHKIKVMAADDVVAVSSTCQSMAKEEVNVPERLGSGEVAFDRVRVI